MIPIDYVDGLGKAELCGSELYMDGVDEEDTEDFRARVKEAMRSIAFGGNVADYTQKVLEIDGVGQVKVHPIWNGPGTVKLVVTSNDLENPEITSELLDEISDMIDPDAGKGYGLAPIGHVVTVENAEPAEVDVALEVTMKTGVTTGEVETAVTPVITDYFASLVKKWSATGESGVSVLPSVISYKILDDEQCAALIESVDSVTITANESTAAAWANVSLETDQVPVVGTITVE